MVLLLTTYLLIYLLSMPYNYLFYVFWFLCMISNIIYACTNTCLVVVLYFRLFPVCTYIWIHSLYLHSGIAPLLGARGLMGREDSVVRTGR